MRSRNSFSASFTLASLAIGTTVAFSSLMATTRPVGAVVYCQYVDYPPSCVARAGVVLRPRPIAREAVRPGTPANRGGPVNRVGRR
jgi:hypothetical protein